MIEREHLSEDLGADLLSAVIPASGTIARRLVRAIRLEWQRNTSRALSAASAASGLSREELEEAIERDPRIVPLYVQILWAAGMNGHEETLRTMGTVFGAAAKAAGKDDSTGLEEAELALRAMANLLPRHFRVLGRLAESRVRTGPEGAENYAEMVSSYIATRAGVTEDAAHQCMLNLAEAGLVSSFAVLDGTAFPITDLGRAVVEAGRRRAHQDPKQQ